MSATAAAATITNDEQTETQIKMPTTATTTTATNSINNKNSLISTLYSSVRHIETCEPHIKIGDLSISASDLQKKMIASVPFHRYKQKSFNVLEDDRISVESVNNVVRAIQKLDRVDDPTITATINLVCVQQFKEVKFRNASMKEGKGFQPACFAINVPECLPNSVQCINTGYVINVPREAKRQYILNKELITESVETEQNVMCVLIPQIISSKDPHIVPQLIPRDIYDTGHFTFNIYNATGKPANVMIALFGCMVNIDTDGENANIKRTTNLSFVKAKDSVPQNGRFIKNYDVGVYYDLGTINTEGDDTILKFELFDKKNEKRPKLENDYIEIKNLPTLISSRKREWADPNLFTLSGVFLGKKAQSCLPIVARNSKYTENAFCVTHLLARFNIFTKVTTVVEPHFTILNGSQITLPHYKELRRFRKKMIQIMQALRNAALACHNYDSTKYNDMDLLRIFDFGQPLFGTNVKKNVDKYYALRDNVEELKKINNHVNTYSMSLMNCFRQLANVFYDSMMDTPECSKVSSKKRANEDEAVNGNEKRAKL